MNEGIIIIIIIFFWGGGGGMKQEVFLWRYDCGGLSTKEEL